jgi:pseudaminic acid synthase
MTPYIVAEIAAAHNQSKERAEFLIRAAYHAGADAVKFQTWTPDTMVASDITLTSGPWAGQSLVELYRKAHTPWEWHKHLAMFAQAQGLSWFSSVFDLKALDFLESLGCPRYKIASFELVDLELIRAVAKTGKPIVLSTGMATREEINRAVGASKGCSKLTLLKCTSAYPTDARDANLRTMVHLGETWDCEIGLSDHSIGSTLAVAATALGAAMIEKHLTVSRDSGGLDDGYASTPFEFGDLVKAVKDCSKALGTVRHGSNPSENSSVALRRSLWLARPVLRGQTLTKEDVVSARPAGGMPCSDLEKALGRVVIADRERGKPLTWDILA